ncbi:MAG TPA: protein tyrosine phosphatase [Caulobacteraceae bacterium]|jgi:protein tyrosine/serine phosphatase
MAKTFDLTTPSGRRATVLHHLWNDHAYLRLAWTNAHWISDELMRSNQPWPFQIKAWRDLGIRTVVNLRGGADSHHALEEDACARYGLKLISYPVRSRDVPTAQQILGARALFDGLEYPAVLHCKSGADRAGVMSVLYMHFRKGQPIRQAMDQLHLRYGHFRAGQTGVLDFYFEYYLAHIAPRGLSLEDWAREPDYDPDAIRRDFKAQWWGTLITEKLLRRE